MSLYPAPLRLNPIFNSSVFIPDETTTTLTVGDDSSDLLSSNNLWSGINTFNSFPIVNSIPTSSTQLINKNYVDSTFSKLATDNLFTGVNTYSNFPITAGIPSGSTQLVNKNYTDSTFSKLAIDNTFTAKNTFSSIFESVSVSSGTNPPFTLDFSLGNVFYLPSDYTSSLTDNFNIIITNIPTDTSKTYTLSIKYYQSSTTHFINEARVSDTSSNYLLGTSSTFASPLFSGGLAVLVNSPTLIIQTFIVSSVANSSGTMTRYILSSVSSFY